MTIKPKARRQLTVGELMRQIKIMKIDKDAILRIPQIGNNPWRTLEYLSYCRGEKEVSLW